VRNAFSRGALSSVSWLCERTSAAVYVLKQLVVRHTKDQVLGGQEVLQLPPKTEVDVPGERAALCAVRCALCAVHSPASALDRAAHLALQIPPSILTLTLLSDY